MRFWWVNHNQTFEQEFNGGFLWSPKRKSNGDFNYYYEAMTFALPGDIVFSYANTRIKGIGVVQGKASTAPKPDFGKSGLNWDNLGWYLPVEFEPVTNPFRPKDCFDLIEPLLPSKYSPMSRKTKGGIQSVYLAEISLELANVLLTLSQSTMTQVIEDLSDPIASVDEELSNLEVKLKQLEGDPYKIQIVKSRRGQGIFKSNVRVFESECRVTKVKQIKHLRASHIKPWRDSTDSEKIDGNNGLLLAPHIDHLFDRGFISFNKNGALLIASKLEPDVLRKWSIDKTSDIGTFNAAQSAYLEFHRDVIFDKIPSGSKTAG